VVPCGSGRTLALDQVLYFLYNSLILKLMLQHVLGLHIMNHLGTKHHLQMQQSQVIKSDQNEQEFNIRPTQ